MAKVKEYQNWEKIIFLDRSILKSDLKYMSWDQIRRLDNLEVTLAEDNGRILIIENE